MAFIIEENQRVCTVCGYHYRIGARERIELLVDPGSFEETHARVETTDPLEFSVDDVSYLDKIAGDKERSGLNEALLTGLGRIEGTRVALGAMDFTFRGASMGSAVGEKFCRAARDAVHQQIPLVVFTASGGARMQEGILSLMQMAKTADAVRQLNEAGIPYITVLTDPTTAGLYASFASLGDIILAEPGAEIGFTGKRLIKGALKVEIPEGFQTAEYQFKNGFVDRIVSRTEMRAFLGKLLRYLAPEPAVCPAPFEAHETARGEEGAEGPRG